MNIKNLLAVILFVSSFNVNADNTHAQDPRSSANKTKVAANKTSNAAAENDYFDRVFEISNSAPLPDAAQLEAMLSKFLAINTELEKNEGHQSAVLKFLMSETIVNGVGYNLINSNENTLTQTCDALPRMKPLFLNRDYSVYLLVKQLGYEINAIPMTVTEDDYTAGELSRDLKKAVRSSGFETKLIEFSKQNNTPSIMDEAKRSLPRETFQFSWKEYFESPALVQFLNARPMFAYWAKYKIYCSHQEVLVENKAKSSDEIYAALLSKTENEQWLQGDQNIKLHKDIWQSTVDLNVSGTPRKLHMTKPIKADDWVN